MHNSYLTRAYFDNVSLSCFCCVTQITKNITSYRSLISCKNLSLENQHQRSNKGTHDALLRNFFLREMVIPRTNQERPVCDGCNLFFVWECLRGLVFGYRTSSYSNLIYHSLTRTITRTKVPLWFPTMSWSIRSVSLLIFLITRSQESCSHHHNFETFWTIRILILRQVSHRFDISIYVVRSYLPHLPNDSRLVFLSQHFGTTTVRGSPWMCPMRNYRTWCSSVW